MGRPSARTVAIRDRILAALRTEWPLPISTRRVCELLGAHRYDQSGYRTYQQLCALDRLNLVERIQPDPGGRHVYWRFLGDPTDADFNAAVDASHNPAQHLRHQSPPQSEADETDTVLTTLDTYITALDKAEKRFANAAASGDRDAETNAADDLAALVRQFVNVCTNWPGSSR